MRKQEQASPILTVILAEALLLSGVLIAAAAPGDITTEGTVNATGPGSITVASGGGGQTVVKIPSTAFVLSRQTATLETIKPGDYVGVAAKRTANGSLSAVSINIFAHEMAGRVRMGQFPMASGDIMTNAQVMEYAVRVDGRTLYLKYKDGSAAITVPPDTQIHRLVVVPVADLKPGAHVTVRGTSNPDGSITASSVSVEAPR